MPFTTKRRPETAIPGDYAILARSFRRSLLAENKGGRTIQTYLEAVEKFGAFLFAQGMPTDVGNIRREHVEAFIADILGRYNLRPPTIGTAHCNRISSGLRTKARSSIPQWIG